MIKKKIAIIDYGIGNVKSILNALDNFNAETILTNKPEDILNADGVILPGVGAFKTGMENLIAHDLIPVIKQYVKTGKPFLGICLGMQLLLDESEEFGNTKGLGLIKGKVKKLVIDETTNERLPHVSWNEIKEPEKNRWQNSILENVQQFSDVYFVHSFAAAPSTEADILATCNYGNKDFCAAVKKENVFGVQFHPEKSGKTGLAILKKFIDLIK
ncbi:MAG: imidazole glycerol phosphate synthase subunit HisH [Bacteroidota bacterium]|nr:imidazole glycerol phosphate synthase subunit HisH [Bacteroidota bacterium]